MTRDPLQGCTHYVPGLRSTPWWHVGDVPQAAVLERHAPEIAYEFSTLVLAGRLRLHRQSIGGPGKSRTDGDWNIYELWTKARPHVGNLADAPVTSRVLESLGDAIEHPRGLIYFSVLQPGVHVQAHCGPTNTRIRLQLGLQIPDGCWIRVGRETRRWARDKVIVFDDSWEHEAANESTLPRAVLIVDVWHPDLDAAPRLGLRSGTRPTGPAEEQGWLRASAPQATVAGAIVQSIDPAIFGAIAPARVARLLDCARAASNEDDAFVSAAGRAVVAALAQPGARRSRADDQALRSAEPADLWATLARLGQRDGNSDTQLADLVTICGLGWRMVAGRAGRTAAFLREWAAEDHWAVADRLTAAGGVAARIAAIQSSGRSTAPFDAYVPIVTAGSSGLAPCHMPAPT